MVDLEQAKEEVLFFCRTHSHASFIELQRELEHRGIVEKSNEKIQINHPKSENLIMWVTDNTLLSRSVISLHNEDKLLVNVCEPLIYAMDGVVPQLPPAKSIRDYKEPHWLPVTFSVNPEKVPDLSEEEHKKAMDRVFK
jgi:hypothetical protein